ncbi:uncharacterized protein BP5553_03990 [Venustampulla echinocandica]|uniref:Ubiquitin 3 binding protein But2 C-terminal domain-containing protein n=1 Tax=Venustampulla echinocandica TaxID=2656787 RepID=A0A370TVU5_9HELO|nr:uncharacterized protein BP5553_03990 [Venustampulla echinocandica]RDL39650.1 hypothetical protein BP5553_03990 [Venustampulla echinocandica]
MHLFKTTIGHALLLTFLPAVLAWRGERVCPLSQTYCSIPHGWRQFGSTCTLISLTHNTTWSSKFPNLESVPAVDLIIYDMKCREIGCERDIPEGSTLRVPTLLPFVLIVTVPTAHEELPRLWYDGGRYGAGVSAERSGRGSWGSVGRLSLSPPVTYEVYGDWGPFKVAEVVFDC